MVYRTAFQVRLSIPFELSDLQQVIWPLTSQNSPAIRGDRHEKSIALQDDDSNVRGQSENSGRTGER